MEKDQFGLGIPAKIPAHMGETPKATRLLISARRLSPLPMLANPQRVR